MVFVIDNSDTLISVGAVCDEWKVILLDPEFDYRNAGPAYSVGSRWLRMRTSERRRYALAGEPCRAVTQR